MLITAMIAEANDDMERHNEGEWSNTTSQFDAFNDAGVECETGEFLYSLVRLLKPDKVLETGTHIGVGAMYMGYGLRHNGRGKLTTLEFNGEFYDKAVKHIKNCGLTNYVDTILGDVTKFQPTDKYDLIFLDTEPNLRFDEFERFHRSLNPGGFIFIHDLHRHMSQHDNPEHGFGWPYGELSEYFKDRVKTGQYRPFHFSTPRGLTGFYKVHPDDYEWK